MKQQGPPQIAIRDTRCPLLQPDPYASIWVKSLASNALSYNQILTPVSGSSHWPAMPSLTTRSLRQYLGQVTGQQCPLLQPDPYASIWVKSLASNALSYNQILTPVSGSSHWPAMPSLTTRSLRQYLGQVTGQQCPLLQPDPYASIWVKSLASNALSYNQILAPVSGSSHWPAMPSLTTRSLRQYLGQVTGHQCPLLQPDPCTSIWVKSLASIWVKSLASICVKSLASICVVTGQYLGQITGQYLGQVTGQYLGQVTGQQCMVEKSRSFCKFCSKLSLIFTINDNNIPNIDVIMVKVCPRDVLDALFSCKG